MDPLRWRFKINVDVEETGYVAESKGFSVHWLEGQSRTNEELYPLNQIEIKGWDLDSKVKVVISPRVTQVYFYLESTPGIVELENIVADLGKVEQIMNEVTVFSPNETARFSVETEIPVMSIGLLKTQDMLKEHLQKVLYDLTELFLKELTNCHILMAEGKIGYAMKRLESLSRELYNSQRSLIDWAKEQGIADAKKWESSLLQLERFEAEVRSVRLPIDLKNLINKYWSSSCNLRN